MQHFNINLLDLVILDGVEYRLASHEPEGIVLISGPICRPCLECPCRR